MTAEVMIDIPFYDIDSLNVVWHGNYVKYLEIARCELLNNIGYNYAQMKASGYVWPVIDLQLRYIEPIIFNQKIKIHATLIEYQNRLKINYLITDAETGRRLTKASTTQVAVKLETKEMCFESPEVLLAKIGELAL
ncbi:MAG TPA: acyl-CoA thioesterase [Gammaproteobacteria bacterium]|nr:acyl-CoA thioesterase [Gammaproteobacteria bacterium]